MIATGHIFIQLQWCSGQGCLVQLQDILENKKPAVVVHLGTKNIGRRRDEILQYEFKVAI